MNDVLLADYARRSLRLRRGAYAILGAILLLIVAGIYVFRTAEQITAQDINGYVNKTSEENRLESENLQSQDAADARKLDDIRTKMQGEVKEYFSAFQPHATGGAQDTVRFDGVPLSQLDGDRAQKTIESIVENHKEDPLTLWVVFNQQLSYYTLLKQQWLSIASNLHKWKPVEVRARARASEDAIATRQKREAFLGQVNNVLAKRLVDIAAGIDPGVQDNNPSAKQDPIFRLIQTNFTRFGTLAVITFLISIFVPLYRYNMRLAAFYIDRSDALILYESTMRDVGFEALVSSLTPGIDFGKTPQTPVEQIVNLIRAAGRAKED